MIKQTLLEIGLSGNEADIYLALLELGPSLVSEIAKKTKINRTKPKKTNIRNKSVVLNG